MVKHYESLTAASNDFSVANTTIKKYIEEISHPKFIFKFDEEILTPKQKRQQKFWYAQYTFDGMFVKKFSTITQAAQAISRNNPKIKLQTAVRSIPRSFSGGNSSAYSFQWRRFLLNDIIPEKIAPLRLTASRLAKKRKLDELQN